MNITWILRLQSRKSFVCLNFQWLIIKAPLVSTDGTGVALRCAALQVIHQECKLIKASSGAGHVLSFLFQSLCVRACLCRQCSILWNLYILNVGICSSSSRWCGFLCSRAMYSVRSPTAAFKPSGAFCYLRSGTLYVSVMHFSLLCLSFCIAPLELLFISFICFFVIFCYISFIHYACILSKNCIKGVMLSWLL